MMRSVNTLLVLVALHAAHGFGHAQSREVGGWVTDRASGKGVSDATVTLAANDTTLVAVTDRDGAFKLRGVGVGRFELTVTHVAYGSHSRPVEVGDDAVLTLRILVDAQAIEIEPVVVEALSTAELERRSRGTMRQEVTRAEIERALPTSRHLGDILRQTVPGLRVYDSPLSGARVCVEFRGRRSIRLADGCQSPMLLLDGVRMFDPPSLYGTIEPGSIERIEVIPPSEAGLLYGSDSAYGVITIETKLWADSEERVAAASRARGTAYDWTLEPRGHRTGRTLLAAAGANALGVLGGLLAANHCLEFDKFEQNLFSSRCGTLGTIGAWGAAVALPLAGSALGARLGGATSRSRGRFLPAVAAGGMALVPGYALMVGTQDHRSSLSFRVGGLLTLIGIPFAATIADRLFRSTRE